MIPWIIGSASASLLFFVAYVLFSTRNYVFRFKNKYDMRNYFPYEFNYESKFTDNLFGNIALTLCSAFSLAFFAVLMTYMNFNSYLIFSAVAGSLLTILMFTINFISLKFGKTHLIIATIMFAVSFALPGSIALASLHEYQSTKEAYGLVLLIISTVIAIGAFILTMNPKLTLNIKMVSKIDESGEAVLTRPKYIVIAFTEWISFFLLFVDQILLIILLIFIK